MVITKRYNSVERFTSMELSSDGLADGMAGGGLGPRPSQLSIPIQHQHVTLMRRPSNEQLLQPAPPSSPSSAATSLPFGPMPPQSRATHPPAPSPFIQQQPPSRQSQQLQPNSQYPAHPPSQQQTRPYPQPRSIMRPSPGQQAAAPYQPQSQPQSRQSPAVVMPAGRPYGMMPVAGQFQQKSVAPQHLADVYSQSGDDAELADNMRSFFASKVPAPIWLTLSAIQIIAGIVSLFIGALNASPYNCRVEPNIPVYLIISGILLVVNGGIRIFFFLTSSSSSSSSAKKRRQMAARNVAGMRVAGRRKGGGASGGSNFRHLCEYALEGTVLFGILIIVILGCVWVYGASRYMHNQRYMFEYHYCHPTVYWTGWWSVTLHLGFFALLILAAIILLVYGALMG